MGKLCLFLTFLAGSPCPQWWHTRARLRRAYNGYLPPNDGALNFWFCFGGYLRTDMHIYIYIFLFMLVWPTLRAPWHHWLATWRRDKAQEPYEVHHDIETTAGAGTLQNQGSFWSIFLIETVSRNLARPNLCWYCQGASMRILSLILAGHRLIDPCSEFKTYQEII